MANGCKVIEGRQHRYWCTHDDPDQQRRCPFHAGPDWCVHNTSPRGDFGDWCWSTDAARDAEDVREEIERAQSGKTSSHITEGS